MGDFISILFVPVNIMRFFVSKSFNKEILKVRAIISVERVSAINMKYLPKIELENYFSTLGGLISMWFGLSAFSLMETIIPNITESINLFIIYLVQKTIPKKIIDNLNRVLKTCSFIAKTLLMCFHTSKVIRQFIESNKNIILVPSKKIILPRLFLHYLFIVDPSRDSNYQVQKDMLIRKGQY